MVIFPILQGGGFSSGDTIARRLGGLKLESELFRLLLIWRLYRVVASLRRPTEHFQWTLHSLQYNPDYAGCFNTTLSCLPLTVGYRRFTCKGAMEGTCGAQKTSKVWRFTYLEAGIQLDTNGNNPEPELPQVSVRLIIRWRWGQRATGCLGHWN